MAVLKKAVVVWSALAAINSATAQFAPVQTQESPFGSLSRGDDSSTISDTIVFGGATATPTANGGGGSGTESDSSVVSVISATAMNGEPYLRTTTFPVVDGTMIVKTTNLLGQSTTLYMRPPAQTAQDSTASSTSDSGAPTATGTSGVPLPAVVSTVSGGTNINQPSTPAASSASSNPAAATQSLSQASNPSSSSSSHMSSGAIAAAVVVPVVVVLALIALAIFFLRRRRRNTNNRRSVEPENIYGAEDGTPAMQQRDSAGLYANRDTTDNSDQIRHGTSHSHTRSVADEAPRITGEPGTAWHTHNPSGDGLVSPTPGSTRSDPFRDPTGSAASSAPQPASHLAQAVAVDDDDDPISPTHDAYATPRSEREDDPVARAVSPMTEVDEEAEIMSARVGTAQRASVVQMRPSPPKTSHLHSPSQS